jgi:hypothetical protein
MPLALLAALLLAACETSGVIGGAPADDVQPDPPLPPPPFQAADSALLRLTQEQYRNTVTDVFGEHVVVAGGLENDNRVTTRTPWARRSAACRRVAPSSTRPWP